jgi:hypothetical protein
MMLPEKCMTVFEKPTPLSSNQALLNFKPTPLIRQAATLKENSIFISRAKHIRE